MAGMTSIIPKKVEERLKKALKHYQPIVSTALAKDINEADTAKIVTEILSGLFGYDKFEEITSEHAIRGSYCDLAVVVEGRLEILFEVKAVGLTLKDIHTRQAINYAANQGTEWVVLTNGVVWRIYHVDFAKPVSEELVAEFNFLNLDPKNPADIEHLFLLTKEGIRKSALDEFHSQKQALNKFNLAAIIMSEPIVKVIRRELKRFAPEVKVNKVEVENILKQEVLKREVVEGERAEEAMKNIMKAISKQAKPRRKAKIEKEESIVEPTGQTEEIIKNDIF